MGAGGKKEPISQELYTTLQGMDYSSDLDEEETKPMLLVPPMVEGMPLYDMEIYHHREKLWGRKMSLLTMQNVKWMIGVQISYLLQRETYNLYRSMKVKGIPVHRATPEQVDFLLKTAVVKPGTRSITFVLAEKTIPFVNDELKKVGLRKKKDRISSKPFVVEKTKINKPDPKNFNNKQRVSSPIISLPQLTTPAIESKPASLLADSLSRNAEPSPFDLLCLAAEQEYTQQTNKVEQLASIALSQAATKTNSEELSVQKEQPSSRYFQPLQITGVAAQSNPLFEFYASKQPNKQGLQNNVSHFIPQIWMRT